MSPKENRILPSAKKVQACFVEAGWSAKNAHILATLVLRSEVFGDSDIPDAEAAVGHQDYQRRVLEGAVDRLCGLRALTENLQLALTMAATEIEEIQDIARQYLLQHMDCTPIQLLQETCDLCREKALPNIPQATAEWLMRMKAIDLESLMDFKKADEEWPWSGWEDSGQSAEHTMWLYNQTNYDVTSPFFWYEVDREAVLQLAMRRMESATAGEVLSIARCVARANQPRDHRFDEWNNIYYLIARFFAGFADALPGWMNSEDSTRVGMRLARLAYEYCAYDLLRPSRFASKEDTSNILFLDTSRKTALRVAKNEIAKLRPILRAGDSDTFASPQISSFFEDCCIVSFELGTLWDGWKPLLLAFRSLGAPALDSGLDFTPQPFEDRHPCGPWNTIPATLIRLFHQHARSEEGRDPGPEDAAMQFFAQMGYSPATDEEFDEFAGGEFDPADYHPREGREEAIDPDLTSFRSEFSRVCLERVKSRKMRGSPKAADNSSQVEPDPIWRYAFVRAARELRINPGGDGHHILYWCASPGGDPDPSVRQAAHDAYNDIRRGDTLGKMSPRRAILYAFWWLARAHMLALNQTIDDAAAQGMRERMVRKTT